MTGGNKELENMLTSAFRCHTGVKQGCMLSPTLFNLYVSDLSEKLKAKNLNDVLTRTSPNTFSRCILHKTKRRQNFKSLTKTMD